MMKKYRLYYENINNDDEFYIDVNNSSEILTALHNNPQYARDPEPDNWKCFHQEEIEG